MSDDNKATILVIEDDPDLRETLVDLLETQYLVRIAEDGLLGLKNAFREPPDLILMDLRMPNMDGFETCKLLRADKEFDNIPIVVLSGFVSDQDRVKALEMGADDFVGKPFNSSELLLRLKKRLEDRVGSTNKENNRRSDDVISYGDIELDLKTQEVTVKGKELHFSQLEFSILHMLLMNADQIVPRETLIETIWPNQEVSHRIIDAHMVSVRNKLKSSMVKIGSVYGKGYRLSLVKTRF